MGKTNRHELTVSPKQLVFLTMIAAIGAVVVFLCGVEVGRGLKAAEAGGAGPIPVPTADGASGAGGAAAEAGSGGAAGSPFQGLSYFDRLRGGEPVAETLEEPPASGPAAPRTGFTGAGGSFAGARGGAFAVQVISVRGAAAAEGVKADLEAKGYPVVIEPMSSGALHRVSVGPYADRAEAELVSRRLRTQERFAAWVTQP